MHRILSFNMMDEDWEMRPRALRRRLFTSVSQRCSTLAGPSANGFVCGQNMDIGGLVDTTQCLLKIVAKEASGDMYFLATGAAPTCGFSSAGLGMLLNTVGQLQPQISGVPVAGLQFEVLAMADRADACNYLNRAPHASGQCYTLVDAQGFNSFECSASGAFEVKRRHANGSYTRTNHPLSDAPLRRVDDPEDQYFLDRLGSSIERLEQIDEFASQVPQLSAETVKAALSCRRSEKDAVSREAGDVLDPASGQTTINFTAGSMVCEFYRDGSIRAHIAGGPPSSVPYERLEVR